MLVGFRCDTSKEIGLGHVKRCLSLAYTVFNAGHDVHFLMRETPEAIAVMQNQPHTVYWIDAQANTASAIQALEAWINEYPGSLGHWLVFDAYEEPWLQTQAAKNLGARVLVLDDFKSVAYAADVVVNGSADAQESHYANFNGTALCGLDYALVHPDFKPLSVKPVAQTVQRILVTLGGSDRRHRILRVLEALSSIENQTIVYDVVLGPAFTGREAVEQFVAQSSLSVKLHYAPEDLKGLLQSADLAITACGTTLYEGALLGVPMIAVVIADNQQQNAQAFSDKNMACVLGDVDTLAIQDIAGVVERYIHSPTLREQLHIACVNALDGLGTERVLACMQSINEDKALNETKVPL